MMSTEDQIYITVKVSDADDFRTFLRQNAIRQVDIANLFRRLWDRANLAEREAARSRPSSMPHDLPVGQPESEK